MALWQINFIVLPDTALADYPKFKGTHISEFDDSIYWNPLAIGPTFFKPIDSFLQQTDWWTKDILLFGDENSNRVEVLIDNDIVQSVSFRIDFRSQYEPIVNQLIAFFNANNLVVFDEYLQLMPLDFEAFNISIQNNKQVKIYNTLANKS